jgi:hypothetical protein
MTGTEDPAKPRGIENFQDAPSKLEWAIAVLLTVLAVWLHLVFMTHAGPLWRDEAGTVNLAMMPSLSSLWSHLCYDSFPVFWPLVLRVWTLVGLGGDGPLRFLGFLVGVGILGVLWNNARTLGTGVPMFSLVLIGFSPSLLIWGDSLRAWGWGVIWVLLTFGSVWKVVESPSRRNAFCAALAALGAVQSTYYNSVLLFAICVGGAAVALRRGAWKTIGVLLGIGVVAAVSLLPYVGTFRRGAGHYMIVQQSFDLETFWTKISAAFNGAGEIGPFAWVLLLIAAVVVGVLGQFRPVSARISRTQSDLLLFSVTAMVVGAAAYFIFLKVLRFGTQDWYYVALLALGGLTADAILSAMRVWDAGRTFRLAFVIFLAATTLIPASDVAEMRMTNSDVVAQRVGASADKLDLIVVNPWFYGISFRRYYPGPTPCVGIPNIADWKIHRYDQVKEVMASDQSEVMREVLARIAETLKSGHRVWLVGGIALVRDGLKPATLSPAPDPNAGWSVDAYLASWSMQVGYFVQSHAEHFDNLPVVVVGPSNPFERVSLVLLEGWRDN